MWVVRALLVVAVFVILLGFAIYNAEEKVTVNILNTWYNVPLVVVVFWSCVFGLLVSILLFITVYFKQIGEIRRHKRVNESLSAEIAALRNRPIEEADGAFLLSDKENKK